jgi:uncharacterized membrane protein
MVGIEAWRPRCRLGLSILYTIAGILHLALPKPFLSITPGWVPEAREVILFTGLCEIAGAAGLSVPALRRFAGLALALYAVCVFPANVKHAVDSLSASAASPWLWLYHGPRLILQPVLVWLPLLEVAS